MIEEIKKEIEILNNHTIMGDFEYNMAECLYKEIIKILDKFKNEPSYYYCNECKKWSDLYVKQMNLECNDCLNKKICHDNHWCIQKGCGKHCNNFKNKYEPFKIIYLDLKDVILSITTDLRLEKAEHNYENDDLMDDYLAGKLLIANKLNTVWQELEKTHLKEEK